MGVERGGGKAGGVDEWKKTSDTQVNTSKPSSPPIMLTSFALTQTSRVSAPWCFSLSFSLPPPFFPTLSVHLDILS